MKIVINKCHGGFGLSDAAYEKMIEWGIPALPADRDGWARENRTHPMIIKAVTELGSAANGDYASLAVVDIPDDVEWQIDEYDGLEWVAESHRTWS